MKTNDGRRFSARKAFLTALVACCAGAQPAFAADEAGLLEDTWVLSLGTFLLSTKTELGLNGSAGQSGTVVDLERDLGLNDADRFRLDAAWRFAKRHRVRALWFDTSNSASKRLERQITVGDTTYPVNVLVEAQNSTTIIELAYEYSFLQRPDFEVAASVGVHGVKFEFGVSGQGTAGNQALSARKETAVSEAPLPVLGLRGMWQFAPKWYLEGQVQYFTLSIDGFDGDITDLRVGVTRMFGEHWGIGAGWNQFNTNVELSQNRFTGSLDWKYSGAQFFVTAAF